MNPVDFGSVGILQIGGNRYGFRPLEVYTEFGHAPIMKGEFLSDVFQASNRYQGTGVAYDKIPASPTIKNVYFNDPVTVVIRNDGTKTIIRCQPGDTYSKETGLALCIAKKYLGNKGNFNEVFKKWIPEEVESVEKVEKISVDDMRRALEVFCEGNHCHACPLCEPVCRCGYGTHFGKDYDMTDDEIRAAYKVVFK